MGSCDGGRREDFLFFGYGNWMQEGRVKAGNGGHVEWMHDDGRLEDGVHGAITELANPQSWLLKRTRQHLLVTSTVPGICA